MRSKIIVIAIVLSFLIIGSAKAADKEVLDRIPVTGCVYGDSIPMDMCDKFKPEVQQAKSIAEDTVEPNPIDTSNWGK
jgi:hypothetical protein